LVKLRNTFPEANKEIDNMIEPEISLAFSIQSKKGIYALLLGSGVSRSSAIPTSWEIVEDLIRKLAKA
jgi:hypothetical protein